MPLKGAAAFAACVLLASIAVSGCSDDPMSSDAYRALAEELGRTRESLAEVTAERDALAAHDATTAARFEAAKANQAALLTIIEDPTAFGTEDEVLDLEIDLLI